MLATNFQRRRVRIVIVEGYGPLARCLQGFLVLHGYEVRVAYSGVEAVRLAVEWPPDVVLCEIGLPGLDGHGVATLLRRHPATARARFIAVTTYSPDVECRRSPGLGFERHLVKPLDPRLLLDVLATR